LRPEWPVTCPKMGGMDGHPHLLDSTPIQSAVRDGPAELVSDGLVTVPEAAAFLSLSRSTLYALMERGDLPYVRIGAARRIPRKALIALASSNLTSVRTA
jgi:excisionase family DNA binding protein